MADFESAFEKMIKNEGGFVLHEVKNDRGGQTYAGIARRYHPNWSGWALLDAGDIQSPILQYKVQEFYQEHFWRRLRADDLKSQAVAELIFDFAVNAGVNTATKLAQLTLEVEPDGILGTKTINALNLVEHESFALKYSLAKISRYVNIVRRDRTQEKFLLGWLNRTLGGLA